MDEKEWNLSRDIETLDQSEHDIMRPESGIMEWRHQRHVSGLRCCFLLPGPIHNSASFAWRFFDFTFFIAFFLTEPGPGLDSLFPTQRAFCAAAKTSSPRTLFTFMSFLTRVSLPKGVSQKTRLS